MLWVMAVPCHPVTQAGQRGDPAAPFPQLPAEMPRNGDGMAMARAGNGQPCPHPCGMSGWRRRWQDSQKHQALRVHQGDLGNLEDPVGWWGKRKKKGKK